MLAATDWPSKYSRRRWLEPRIRCGAYTGLSRTYLALEEVALAETALDQATVPRYESSRYFLRPR